MALVANLLRHPKCRIEHLDLTRQRPGDAGIAALVSAIEHRRRMEPLPPPLKRLTLKSCRFGDEGGKMIEKLLKSPGGELDGLLELDLQNNLIGFDTCENIMKAAKGKDMVIKMQGNRPLDEVLNAVSHGVALIGAIVGTVFLGRAVSGQCGRNIAAVTVYCVSLCVLFAASMFLHSFQMMGPNVVRIFGVLDHCSIYLLIAGSYCPFLAILFPGNEVAQSLMLLLLVLACMGMMVSATYYGPWKSCFELSLYLGMGWSAVYMMTELTERLGPDGTRLLIAGGVLYTAGVPFFIKDKRTLGFPDHTIWHLFVNAASAAHYYAILWYCVPFGNPPVVDLAPAPGLFWSVMTWIQTGVWLH
eukprot:TRINITY_DN70550_c0_g1_i2.p1 TRINITY_DN70550_c0_g1~~TRINITY_DN70550_c0_g1_i2.p1  ORF type:complete len:383 (+),score=54.31 TRINITY_DN70550_c0_g1_i2:73-1149(+)